MEKIVGKFQGGENFGFLIPKNREFYGGDFFVSKKHFGGAIDGDLVEGIEIKSSGKKPEAVITKVLTGMKKKNNNEDYIEGIFSLSDGDFGFIDVVENEKGYFVFGKNSMGAKDGDKVKAQVVEYKGKKEAKIVKILESEFKNLEGEFRDNDSFGFVITKEEGDIFIPGFKKNGAKNGDKVEVKVTKMGKKNKEGIIIKIL